MSRELWLVMKGTCKFADSLDRPRDYQVAFWCNKRGNLESVPIEGTESILSFIEVFTPPG